MDNNYNEVPNTVPVSGKVPPGGYTSRKKRMEELKRELEELELKESGVRDRNEYNIEKEIFGMFHKGGTSIRNIQNERLENTLPEKDGNKNKRESN